MFCKYKDILGQLGGGVHSYRLFNIAVMDVLMTIIGAYIIHSIFPKYSFIAILIGLFLLGIFLHRLFCVRTTIDKFLFRSKNTKL
jgi:hypothetical protein